MRRDLSKELALRNLAYLDAGTGSMIASAIAAGFAGIMVVFKMFGAKIVRTLTFWKKDPEVTSEYGATDELTSTPLGEDQAS